MGADVVLRAVVYLWSIPGGNWRPNRFLVFVARGSNSCGLHCWLMDILQALQLIIIVAFAMAEGFSHAILYGRKGHESFNWNEHWVFTVMRLLFGFAITIPGSPLVVVSGLCMYPFFHNGMYYTQRDRIDGSYPRRWWDMTKGSSAKTNFSVEQRIILAIHGLVLFVLMQIFDWKL